MRTAQSGDSRGRFERTGVIVGRGGVRPQISQPPNCLDFLNSKTVRNAIYELTDKGLLYSDLVQAKARLLGSINGPTSFGVDLVDRRKEHQRPIHSQAYFRPRIRRSSVESSHSHREFRHDRVSRRDHSSFRFGVRDLPGRFFHAELHLPITGGPPRPSRSNSPRGLRPASSWPRVSSIDSIRGSSTTHAE